MVDHCARLMGHCPLCPMTNVCIASGDNGKNRWGTNPLRRLLSNAPDVCHECRAPASMKGWRSGTGPPQLRTQTSDDVRWPPQIKHLLALSDVRSRRSEPSLARWLAVSDVVKCGYTCATIVACRWWPHASFEITPQAFSVGFKRGKR